MGMGAARGRGIPRLGRALAASYCHSCRGALQAAASPYLQGRPGMFDPPQGRPGPDVPAARLADRRGPHDERPAAATPTKKSGGEDPRGRQKKEVKDAWLAPSAPRDPSCRGPPPGRPPCGGRPSDGPAPPGRPLRGRPLGGAPPGRPPSGGRPLGGAPPGRPPNGGRPLGGPAPPGRPRRGPGPTRSPSGPGGLCSRAPSPASWCRRSVGSPLGGVSLALTRGLLGYRGSLCFAEHHAPPEKQVRVIWYRLDIIVQIATKFDTIFYHAIRNLIAKRLSAGHILALTYPGALDPDGDS